MIKNKKEYRLEDRIVDDEWTFYCEGDCEITITDRLIVEHEWPIILTIFMLFPAMIMTAQYMADKYSPTTQTQEQGNDERGTR